MDSVDFFYISDLTFVMLAWGALLGSSGEAVSSKAIYAVAATLMVCLTFFRPLGMSPDDPNYLIMVQRALVLTLDQQMEFYGRDPIYYFILTMTADTFGSGALLLIAAATTIGKLYLLFRLTQNPILALYAYFCLSFFLQDIIQFRESMALAFSFLALFVWERRGTLFAVPLALAAGLCHFTGFIASLLAGIEVLAARLPARLLRVLYFVPLPIIVLQKVGFSGTTGAAIEWLTPNSLGVARELSGEVVIRSEFNLGHMLIYLAIAFSGPKVLVNRSSNIGLLALDLSAFVVLLFTNLPTLGFRLNEFFLAIYVLNIGSFKTHQMDPRRLLLIAALAAYYMRLRTIGLVTQNG